MVAAMFAIVTLADPTTYYLDPTNGDDVNNDGLSKTSAFKTLDKAVNKTARDAGDTIVIVAGTHIITSDISGNMLPNWHLNVTICGETGDPKDVVLKSDGENHRFCWGAHSATTNMTFSGLTFCNFTNSLQGAVLFIGQNGHSYGGVVSNCVFRNCHSSLNGEKGAGAIHSEGVNTRIVDCVFENCTAFRDGGAIYHTTATDDTGEMSLGLTGCTFKNCRAGLGVTAMNQGSGGAVYVSGPCPVRVSGCSFTDCRAVYQGGAIALVTSGSSHHFTDCAFTNNCATGLDSALTVACGGAIWNVSGGTTGTGLVLERCHFTGNFIEMIPNKGKNANVANTPSMGGAVYGDVQLAKDCTFVGNHTDVPEPTFMVGTTFGDNSYGGACGNKTAFSGLTTYDTCTFEGNWADGWGGALSFQGDPAKTESKLLITNCIFKSNKASMLGGTVFQKDNAATPAVEVVDTVFDGNATCEEYGIRSRSNGTGPGTWGTTIFDVSAAEFTMRRCQFINNVTHGGASAVLLRTVAAHRSCWVEDCLFTNNCNEVATVEPLPETTSSGYGYLGSVFDVNSRNGLVSGFLFRNCLFANNRNRETVGGPLVFEGSQKAKDITVENCTFVGNSAKYTGVNAVGPFGGLYFSNVDTGNIVRNVIFADNFNEADETRTDVRDLYGAKSYITNCLFKTVATNPNFVIQDGYRGCKVGYDPKFYSAANGDYRIVKRSPARDAGDTQDWMREEGAHDLTVLTPGKKPFPRVTGDVVDIGCYEWAHGNPPEPGMMLIFR